MLGEPGTYDASVYDSLPDKDLEGCWFQRRYAHLGVDIEVRSVTRGDSLPQPGEAHGFVLGGTYNSVHDDYPWQRAILSWLPEVREAGLPLFGICGAHQLLSTHYGAPVSDVPGGPCVGTLAVELNAAGSDSPLFRSVESTARFHFANSERVTSVPTGAVLLATADRLPVAALDYGNNWYSSQFHPEASAESLAISWSKSHPQHCDKYDDGDDGDQLIGNFFEIVRRSMVSV